MVSHCGLFSFFFFIFFCFICLKHLIFYVFFQVKYSREPDNPTKSCKARGSDLRVHFKFGLFVKPDEKSRDLLPFVNGSLVNFREISCIVIG
ncbi:unnamed protein product, partial [Vitis vinifera]